MAAKIKANKLVWDVLVTTFGCVLLAFSIASVLKPNGLVTGGFTGLSIILGHVLKIDYTYLYYGFSLAVLLSAFIFLGKKDGVRIVFMSAFFPLLLIAMDRSGFALVEDDLILGSIYFGVIGGIGCGLVFKRGLSFGGTDTVAKILRKRLFPFVSLSQILLVIDVSVVMLAALVFDRNIALYGIISQYVFVKSVDMVLFGFGSKKLKIEIISEENEAIADYIMRDLGRGATIYHITGGYTNTVKQKIITICSPRETMLIKRYVGEVDPKAFVDVLPVVSVWGEGIGFRSLQDDEY